MPMTKIVKKHIGFHFFIDKNTDVYLDTFGIEYIPQEVLNKIGENQLLTL